jgi:DNA-binding transcriptional regulator GbsR (MarR family)
MVGRVLEVSVVSEVPELSSQELAGEPGSISTTTHMLEQIGIIERVGRPGERRDYFRNKPGPDTTSCAASWRRSRCCAGWPRRG